MNDKISKPKAGEVKAPTENPAIARATQFRRNLLKILGAGALLYAVADYENVISFVGYHAYRTPAYLHDVVTSAEYDAETNENIKHLEDRYSSPIKFATVGETDLPRKKELLVIMKRALSKYPPEFVQKLGLQFDLEWQYEPDEKGEADSEGGVIKIITNTPISPGLIHHEIHHVAEGKLAPCDSSDDWSNLNPNGADDYIGDKWQKHEMDPPTEAFFMPYQRMNCHEDQTRLVELLFATAEKPAIMVEVNEAMKEANLDTTILLQKIDKLKSYYEKWTDGKMGEQYWKDLADGKVDEGYWGKK